MTFNVLKWWRRRRRRIDREMLWPLLERRYPDSRRDQLFAKWMHVQLDPAWRYRSEWRDEEPELNEATEEGVFGL